LKSSYVLLTENNNIIFLQQLKEICNSVSSELPMTADLAKSKKDFENMLIANQTLCAFSGLVIF
jgi:hypothetical protein